MNDSLWCNVLWVKLVERKKPTSPNLYLLLQVHSCPPQSPCASSYLCPYSYSKCSCYTQIPMTCGCGKFNSGPRKVFWICCIAPYPVAVSGSQKTFVILHFIKSSFPIQLKIFSSLSIQCCTLTPSPADWHSYHCLKPVLKLHWPYSITQVFCDLWEY